jgi:hypothetical protein
MTQTQTQTQTTHRQWDEIDALRPAPRRVITAVVTYQSPGGSQIVLCAACAARLAADWPKDGTGQEYCSVSYGEHAGHCDGGMLCPAVVVEEE